MVTKRTVTCSAYYIWQIPAAILDGSLLMAEWRLKMHFQLGMWIYAVDR